MSDKLELEANFDVKNLVGRRATNRWERVSVGDLLERVRWSFPEKEAIVAGAGACGAPRFSRLTYRAADELANQVANALLAKGLRRADTICFLCENSVEAYIAKLGVAKAGLVCAPINPRLPPDSQEYILSLLTPKFAFVDAELWAVASETLTKHEIRGAIIPIGGNQVPDGWVSFEQLVEGAPVTEPIVEIHGDDIWEILPTSGTTSMPKAVMLSHNHAYITAYSYALTHTRGLRFETDLRVCSLLPVIYHGPDQSQSFPAFLCGGTFIIGRQASAANCAALITRECPTHFWAGSPQLIEGLIEEVKDQPSKYDLSSLTSVMFSWASLPPSAADSMKLLTKNDELQLVGILGQIEAISCVRFWPDKWPDIYRASAPRINHIGLPTPILAASIMDDDGQLIEQAQRNVPGEIVYRSPAITAGYYMNAQATRDAFRYGWFHSGDCCMYDENGLLVMIDRYKDVVKSGGENVSTIRVEAVLSRHPAIQKVAVAGLPHARWSEAVTAFVILRPGESVTEKELLAFTRPHLAPFETPKAFVFVNTLPETVGGKVMKYALRKTFRDYYKSSKEVR
jgi:acyl-CoA synthetase (AMP-forming)/AMP-acid ligase II